MVEWPVEKRWVDASLDTLLLSVQGTEVRTRDVIAALRAADIRVLAAGGAPRDWLLGHPALEVDLCLDTDLEVVRKVLGQSFPGVDPVLFHLKRFGMLRWGTERGHVDLNILRSFRDIQDHSMWTTVFPVRKDLVEDAQTRDFSIHAFYYDFSVHDFSSSDRDSAVCLLDPLNCGLQDLEQQRLHFVADPSILEGSFRMTFRIIQFWGRGYHPGRDVMEYLTQNADRDVQGMGQERLERWIGSRYREGKLDLEDFELRLLSQLRESASRRLVSEVCKQQKVEQEGTDDGCFFP